MRGLWGGGVEVFLLELRGGGVDAAWSRRAATLAVGMG